jgi:pyruvate dehydrogenase E2 component (dihydrolipoamide acetyltransferase)
MATTIEVKVPDIGDFKDVPVIEIHVKPGDAVNADDSLVTLESDKATMDVPSPAAGTVKEMKLQIGDKVAEGSLVLLLETGADQAAATPAPQPAVPATPAPTTVQPAPPTQPPRAVVQTAASAAPPTASIAILPPAVHIPTPAEVVAAMDGIKPHASPSVRRFARELGVDVALVKGSGPKGRITQQDVQAFVKGVMAGGTVAPAPSSAGTGLNLLPWPQVDFA